MTKPDASPVKIEYVSLRNMKPWSRNPKKHADAEITASIRRFGFINPLIVNEDTGTMVAGHGRLEALETMRDAGEDMPDRIRQEGADWAVPVLRGVSFMSDAEAEAYGLADNQLTTAGGWDDLNLGEILADLRSKSIDVDGLGWDSESLDVLLDPFLSQKDSEEPQTEDLDNEQIDAADELQKKWSVEAGDVWRCGDHYLVCADATSPDAFDAVPGHPPIAVTFTSPPYGNQRDYELDGFDWAAVVPAVVANCHAHGRGDHQALVNLGLVHRDGRVITYWDPLIERMDNDGAPLFGWYVWDQGCALAGNWNGRLGPSHEFVFHFCENARQANKTVECKLAGQVGHKAGAKNDGLRSADGGFGGWTGAGVPIQSHKIPDSVIRQPRQYGGIAGHPAPFSVAFARFVIEAYSSAGDVVCDPFMGSGTTMIAAEESGRSAVGIDIEPKYIAVALERWSAMTGRTPERVDG
jgi:DNA modification methylase